MAPSVQQRIQTFATALQFTGGRARPVSGSYQVATAIEQIVAEHGDGRAVLFEPFELADDLGLGLALRARGLELVPVAAAGAAATEIRVGLTGATLAVAESGSLLVGGEPGGWGLATILPWVHVAVVHARDIEPTLASAFARLRIEFDAGQRNWVWITGPSKTADIEKTVVMGIHGPNALEVLVVHDDVAAAAG